MVRDDANWLRVTDAFHAAAIDGQSWYTALEGLAEITGSHIGELICVGADTTVPLNICTNLDPAFGPAFVAAGGGDPLISPRVGAGSKAPILQTLTESDFISEDEYKRHPHYQEFARQWDIPWICLSTLDRTEERLIGLAVVRNHAQGHMDAEGRRWFDSIAPHVRSAVRTHLALQGHGDAVLVGAMQSMSLAAFICDRSGYVRDLTPLAESIVRTNPRLQLKSRRLVASDAADARALNDAIESAARDRERIGHPIDRTLVIRSADHDQQPLVLDVVPLPHHHRFQLNFEPGVLVLVRGVGANGDKRRATLMQSLYGMTRAEVDIALQLHAGQSPEAIAESRGVSVGTVRVQIKAILAKAGVSRQVELVARIGQL